jgi:hypothetical protein
MPLMSAPEPRPLPLARAQARHKFDDLIRHRLAAIRASTGASHEGNPSTGTPPEPVGALLDALARSFADAVDRENSTRGILRAGVAVEYVDAVVLTGRAGTIVVDADDYESAPVYWQARVSGLDLVVRGRDLDAYLRTGGQQYAEAIGLS